MAEASVHIPYQTPMTCDMCESQYDVLWHCRTCDGNLCTPCKENHSNKKIFQKHVLVPLVDALRQKSEEKEACTTHLSNYYTIHCDQCNVLICSDCAIEEHNGHKLGKIPEVMDRVCRELQGYVDELETGQLAQCKSEDTQIKEDRERCKKWLASIEEEIGKRQKELKKEIDRYCEAMLQEARTEKDKRMSDLDEAKQKIQDVIGEITQLQTRTKDALAKRNSESLQFVKEKQSSANLVVPRFTSSIFPTFQGGTSNAQLLQKQIGVLGQKGESVPGGASLSTDLPAVPPVLDIQVLGKYKDMFVIGSISVVDVDKAWICYPGISNMNLVSVEGKVIKNMSPDFVADDIAVMTSEWVTLTDNRNKLLKTLTAGGKVVGSISTSPFFPNGICLTSDRKKVAVCLTSALKSVQVNVYNFKGKVLQEIRHTSKVVSSTNSKQRVTQSPKGDYCVLTCELKTVFVLDSKGNEQYSYDGSSTSGMSKPFNPTDICYDWLGLLLITDSNNNTIHMLDHHGNYLMFLPVAEHGIAKIHGLDIDSKGNLWIGHDVGQLSVMKYIK